jgi:hypothetical protein
MKINSSVAIKGTVAFLCLFAVTLTIPLILLNAWVITKIWDWYIVRAFGIAPITMITAFGLSILINMLHLQQYNEDKRDPYAQAGGLIAAPLGALLMGWIGTFFM